MENCHSKGVLTNRDSEIRGAIVTIAKINTILKRPVYKLFTVENTYHVTTQTDKEREQKSRREAVVLGEHEYWDGEESLNITNDDLLNRFTKTQEIFPSVTRVLTIHLTTVATSESVD